MPAKSKKQQMAAGAALSAKRGERPKGGLKGASRQMVESMSETELERMASAKRKKLPTRAAGSKSTAKKSGTTARKTSSSSRKSASSSTSRSKTKH